MMMIGFSLGIQAQEKLSSLGSNPRQASGPQTTHKSGQVLTLPFIDDFSFDEVYPSGEKWIDNHVYVNNTLGVDMKSFGIASFDAMDSTGAIYAHAKVAGFTADFMTSQAIDLDLGADTSVYLSFYYQPQGLGDAPEATDSLIVEFFSPQDNQWIWIWSTPGTGVHDFKQVLIPVRGALFMQSGFQFRFKNIASLANAFENSLKTNADHWHIDYVYLNNERHYRDTIFNDLSLKQATGSLLLNYEAMPWEHFQEVGISEVKTIFPINLMNLSGQRKFFAPEFRIVDIDGSTSGFEKVLSADEVQAFQDLQYDATFNYGFTSDAGDSARFRVELDLKPSEQDLIPGNERLIYQQVFTDYYALDDGSAEAGYGLVGEGATNARVAYRFNNYQPGDSLVGVSMFFNRSFEDANHKYFQLAIWNEIDGLPGDLLHIQQGTRASNQMGLTGFDYFELDTSRLVPNVFYVGWYQVTNDFLNVGFDLNSDNQDRIFFNMADQWQNTSFEGSLLVRPVFANRSKKASVQRPFSEVPMPNLIVYPNPASDYLNLDYDPLLEQANFYLIDNTGRQVIPVQTIGPRIDISQLKGGTYFVIIQKDNFPLINKKILVLND